MNKKLLLAIITFFLLLTGCSKKVIPDNTVQQTAKSSGTITSAASNESAEAAKSATTITTSDAIDYNQYIRKTWIDKKGASNAYFSIYKIANEKITGRFATDEPAVPDQYDLENLTGTINKDAAECRFSDTIGNKGNIKLVFKSNNEIEAAIELTDKSQYVKSRPREGTFKFIPYNLDNIKGGFSIIKDQSFMVDLNSWGSVRFVSGKLTAGSHIPVVFYLMDKNRNVLYNFESNFPYGADVKAVSFADVDKNALKDIIIIASCKGGPAHIANVYLQKADGSFANDLKLDQEINDSGSNKDVKAVENYLSQKF